MSIIAGVRTSSFKKRVSMPLNVKGTLCLRSRIRKNAEEMSLPRLKNTPDETRRAYVRRQRELNVMHVYGLVIQTCTYESVGTPEWFKDFFFIHRILKYLIEFSLEITVIKGFSSEKTHSFIRKEFEKGKLCKRIFQLYGLWVIEFLCELKNISHCYCCKLKMLVFLLC